MRSAIFSILAASALAAPATVVETRTVVEDRVVEKRATTNALATELSIFNSLFSVGLAGGASRVDLTSLAIELAALTPTASPTATEDVPSLLSSIYAEATPTGFLEAAVALLLNDLVNKDTLVAVIEGNSAEENSASNTANPNPSQTVYPKKLECDAPYSQSEETLREQLFIPSTFTYGQKPPVILFPGTGGRGAVDFSGNFEVTLANVSYADLVFVNSASFLLEDAQLSSELAAYAINYISAISGNVNVSIIAWSQGNLNIQWATKYWPSTRCILSDHIAISPDYHGTTLANFVDPGNDVTLPPAFIQQEYNSNYVTTLRSNGGDSAYVPTTNIYSAFFDEIVEPQQNPNASAFLLDARNVGVTNAEVQAVCGPDSPAGFFQTHESMLANSLSFALAVDALQNPGPGSLARLGDYNSTICQQPFAPGLSLADVLATENVIPIALIAVLLYPSKVLTEPAISSYALTTPTACGCSATSSATSTASSKAATTTSSSSKASSTSSKTSSISASKTSSTSASKTSSTSTSKTSSISTSKTTTTTKKTTTTTKKAATTSKQDALSVSIGL